MDGAHMAQRHLSTSSLVCVCVCVSCGNTAHHLLSPPGLTIHSQGIDVLPIAEMDFWGCCRRRYAGLSCLICMYRLELWIRNKALSFRNQRKTFLYAKVRAENMPSGWHSEERMIESLSRGSQGLTLGLYITYIYLHACNTCYLTKKVTQITDNSMFSLPTCQVHQFSQWP